MGSYADVLIRGVRLMSFRDSVDPTFMLLFTESDVRTWDDPDEESARRVELQVAIGVLRDRLDVLGLGRKSAEETLRILVANATEFRSQRSEIPDELKGHYRQEAEALTGMSLESWRSQMRVAMDGSGPETTRWEVGSLGWLLTLWDYVDPRFLLRALCEVFADNEVMTLDITQLVESGWIEEDRIDPREMALAHFGWAIQNGAPPIILAEGRSDINILRTAVKVLRPHLAEFLRFADFTTGSEGGAGSLVRVVRTFAAAGVANRVVALFDNDTAAADALRVLDVGMLALRIRVGSAGADARRGWAA